MAFCCCSNATGAQAIAFVWLISGIFLTLGSIFSAYNSALTLVKNYDNLNSTEKMLPFFGGLYSKIFEESLNENVTIEDNEFIGKDQVALLRQDIVYYGIAFSWLSGAFVVFMMVASYELDQGVRQRNYWRCNTFLWWQIGHMVYKVATFPVDIILFTLKHPINMSLSYTLIGWIIGIYCISIVYKFMKEVKAENEIMPTRLAMTVTPKTVQYN